MEQNNQNGYPNGYNGQGYPNQGYPQQTYPGQAGDPAQGHRQYGTPPVPPAQPNQDWLPPQQTGQPMDQSYYPNQVMPRQAPLTPPKKSKLWLIILIICVVSAGLGVGAYFLFFHNKSANGFDEPKEAAVKFFEAINKKDKDQFISCMPGEKYVSADQLKRAESVFDQIVAHDVVFDVSTMKGKWEDTGNTGNYGAYKGTIEYTISVNGQTVRAREPFIFDFRKLDDKWLLINMKLDDTNAEYISGGQTTEAQTSLPTEVPTEQNTETPANGNVYGIAESPKSLVSSVFLNANNRDEESLLWYFVPDELTSNPEEHKEAIHKWLENLKTTDIQYDLTTVAESGAQKSLGDWGQYKEFEQAYTIDGSATQNGKHYTFRQSVTIQYIEAESKTYSLTSFVLSDDYEILSTETASSEEKTESTEEVPTEQTTVEPVSGSGDWINFDDMHFYVNGKKYVLGKSTLQDLIDGGVPFDDRDIGNFDNNVEKNSQSGNYRVVLGEYWTMQLYVINNTDSGKKARDCVVGSIYYNNKKDSSQNVVSFDFPTDMTADTLLATLGDPDDTFHYDGDNGYFSDRYTWQRESTQYIGYCKYNFEFVNGKLDSIDLSWK